MPLPGRVRTVLASLAVLSGGCVDPSAGVGRKELPVTYCAPGETLEGIDVSKWQGEIDWDAVAGAGIQFAFIRATHGAEILDEWFDTNWRRAREVGIARGAYQFFEGGDDPVEQADAFLSMLPALEPGDLPPVIDVESPDGNPGVAQYQDNVRTWLDRVEAALGVPPIIYTGKYYWDDHLGGTDEFQDHPLWDAWWSDSCPDTPRGWSEWTFWQYSSTGRVPGISGNVDRDRFDGTMDDLLALGAGGVCGDGACNGGESTVACEVDCPPCQLLGRDGGTLDETGPCFRGGGDPQYLRSVTAGWEESLIWTHTTDFDRPSNFGEWRLSFAEAGRYLVEAYTAAPYAESTRAAYQVTHAGTTDVVTVDQSAVDGWTSLGEIEFAAGHGQLVRLDDNTGEPNAGDVQLVFDALRFTRIEDPVVGPDPDDPDPDGDPDADPDGDDDGPPGFDGPDGTPGTGGASSSCAVVGGLGGDAGPGGGIAVLPLVALLHLGRRRPRGRRVD